MILTQLEHQTLSSSFILGHLESDIEGPLPWFSIHLLWFGLLGYLGLTQQDLPFISASLLSFAPFWRLTCFKHISRTEMTWRSPSSTVPNWFSKQFHPQMNSATPLLLTTLTFIASSNNCLFIALLSLLSKSLINTLPLQFLVSLSFNVVTFTI